MKQKIQFPPVNIDMDALQARLSNVKRQRLADYPQIFARLESYLKFVNTELINYYEAINQTPNCVNHEYIHSILQQIIANSADEFKVLSSHYSNKDINLPTLMNIITTIMGECTNARKEILYTYKHQSPKTNRPTQPDAVTTTPAVGGLNFDHHGDAHVGTVTQNYYINTQPTVEISEPTTLEKSSESDHDTSLIYDEHTASKVAEPPCTNYCMPTEVAN